MKRIVIFTIILFFCLALHTHAASTYESFYILNGSTFELRPVLEGAGPSENKPGYTWLTDRKGEKYLVSDKVVIDSSDVRIISVRIDPIASIGNQYTLNVYFKPDSWDKVHDVTSRFVDKKLGIFLNGELSRAPEVRDAFDYEASISSLGDVVVITFAEGLKATSEFNVEEFKHEHSQRMRARITNNPSAFEPLSLFQYYTSDEWLECEKAAALVEKISKTAPEEGRTLPLALSNCYRKRGEYAKALSYLEKARTNMDERTYLNFRGEIFLKQGENVKALEDFSKMIELWEKHNPSPEEAKDFEETKDAYIKYYEKRIQKIRESLE